MKPTLIAGIDPGLVHTGVVSMLFVPDVRKIVVQHDVTPGPNAEDVANWIKRYQQQPPTRVFIEEYRPRIGFSTDVRMVEAQQAFRTALPRAKFINNTGVKKIVKRPLMELLGIWRFSTPTHHQDLRSAGRIAVFGMLKDDELNALVTKVVTDHMEGDSWHVDHR